jgi:hypothetical protein
LAAFVFVLSVCLPDPLGAQRPGVRDSENSTERSEKRTPGIAPLDLEARQRQLTPLGAQVPVERALQKQGSGDVVEPASDVLRRVGLSKGKTDQSRSDMVADGTVTVHTASGPIAFGVMLIQNGEPASQRILIRQPNGKSWDGRLDHLALGAGPALEFLETQYRRGLQLLLKSSGRGFAVADNGVRDSLRVVTVREDNGQSTKYSLDPATSRIARFEFIRGESSVSVGNRGPAGPVVHSYSFSDFRSADGVATPFHIEHIINGVKQEELQLTKVRYNSTEIDVQTVRPTGR